MAGKMSRGEKALGAAKQVARESTPVGWLRDAEDRDYMTASRIQQGASQQNRMRRTAERQGGYGAEMQRAATLQRRRRGKRR